MPGYLTKSREDATIMYNTTRPAYFSSSITYSATYVTEFTPVTASASQFGIGNECILSDLGKCCDEILIHLHEDNFWGENGKHLSSTPIPATGICSKFTPSVEANFQNMLQSRACDIYCGEQEHGSTFLWCIKPHKQAGLEVLSNGEDIRCGWFYQNGVQGLADLNCIKAVNNTYWHIYPDQIDFNISVWMLKQWTKLK